MLIHIAVIGSSEAAPPDLSASEDVGRAVASAGAVLVCGGLGGVMEAACRGAKSAGGMTVGILPDLARSDANQWVDVVIPTGIGEARNSLVVSSADAVIAIGGEYGTLSEIALALRYGKPVIGLDTWTLTRPNGETDEGMKVISDPVGAVALAMELAQSR